MTESNLKLDPFKYKGFGGCDSECKVEIWIHDTKDYAFVLLTDLGVGTSVTNFAEGLITEVYKRFLQDFKKDNCVFAETYDIEEGVDRVIPEWDGETVTKVSWKHMGKILDPRKLEVYNG